LDEALKTSRPRTDNLAPGGELIMMNIFTGNPAMFLLVWLLIYALLLFGMSIIHERRQARELRERRSQKSTSFIPQELRREKEGRRAWPRREGNPTPVLLADRNSREWQTGACVVNRSEGGLRLTFSHPYETGRLLRVLSRYAPNDVLWAEVEVRNCRQGNQGYELGCRFAYSHPLNVLLLFG
jgi:hypothetical protein